MATSRRSKKHQKKSLHTEKLEIDKDIFLKFIGKEGYFTFLGEWS